MYVEITISDLEQDNELAAKLKAACEEHALGKGGAPYAYVEGLKAQLNEYGITIFLDHLPPYLPKRLAGIVFDNVQIKHTFEHEMAPGVYYYPRTCLFCLPFYCPSTPSANVMRKEHRPQTSGSKMEPYTDWSVEAWGANLEEARSMFYMVTARMLRPSIAWS